MSSTYKELHSYPKTASLLPSWRSTWAIDPSTGHRKVILLPCTPEAARTVKSGPSSSAHPTPLKPSAYLKQCSTQQKDDHPVEESPPSLDGVNFFDWKAPSVPTPVSLKKYPSLRRNVKRRVWLPSLHGIPRSKTVFTSSGSPGVRVNDYIQNPDLLDNRHRPVTYTQSGHEELQVTISWPGYDDFSQPLSLSKVPSHGDLLNELSCLLMKFLSRAYKITPKDMRWKLGFNAITLRDIWIVGFGYSHCGHWALVLEVEVRDNL